MLVLWEPCVFLLNAMQDCVVVVNRNSESDAIHQKFYENRYNLPVHPARVGYTILRLIGQSHMDPIFLHVDRRVSERILHPGFHCRKLRLSIAISRQDRNFATVSCPSEWELSLLFYIEF